MFLNNIYLYQIYIVIKQREIKKNLKSIITFYINLEIISEMKGGWCYMHAGWKICELYTYYHKSHLNAIKLYDAKCISNRNISWKFVSKQLFQQTNNNQVSKIERTGSFIATEAISLDTCKYHCQFCSVMSSYMTTQH